jgi:hypothetical protein
MAYYLKGLSDHHHMTSSVPIRLMRSLRGENWFVVVLDFEEIEMPTRSQSSDRLSGENQQAMALCTAVAPPML